LLQTVLNINKLFYSKPVYSFFLQNKTNLTWQCVSDFQSSRVCVKSCVCRVMFVSSQVVMFEYFVSTQGNVSWQLEQSTT